MCQRYYGKINANIVACFLFGGIFMVVLLTLVFRAHLTWEQQDATTIGKSPEICGDIVTSPMQARTQTVLHQKEAPPVTSKKEDIRFGSIIQQAADRHQVEPALVRAIIMAESSYNPRAISKKGAKGLMQLMPKTAESLGVIDSFNPEDNIHGGVAYFRKLMNQFDGNVEFALAAYNAGSRNVRKYQGIPPFNATRYYVKKVLQYYQTYKDQMITETGRT